MALQGMADSNSMLIYGPISRVLACGDADLRRIGSLFQQT
jgi:hypothetical protein